MIFNFYDSAETEIIRTYFDHVREKKVIGFTSGSFDLIHNFHLDYLHRCQRHCNLLLVGVDADEHVRKRKGNERPIIPDVYRVEMVHGLKPVTFAFIMNSTDDFGRAAKVFRPHCIIKNNSFDGRENEILGKEYAEEIIILPDIHPATSTTEIIAKIVR